MEKVWDLMMMRPKGLALLLLIILFFAVLLAALCFHTLITLGCIVIVAGIVLPIYLPQWRAGSSFLLILLGVILLLHEQMWFQGFFQNTAITILKKQGKDYGEKLETYNRTMATMSAEGDVPSSVKI
jgi:energy-coupling factor transporter transmembrane protein EcfT